MFQLVSNAIKHCSPNSTIMISFQFNLREESEQLNNMLAGTLITKIKNEGSSKKVKEMNRKVSFKTF